MQSEIIEIRVSGIWQQDAIVRINGTNVWQNGSIQNRRSFGAKKMR